MADVAGNSREEKSTDKTLVAGSFMRDLITSKFGVTGLLFMGGLTVGLSTNMVTNLVTYSGPCVGFATSLLAVASYLIAGLSFYVAGWKVTVHRETELRSGKTKPLPSAIKNWFILAIALFVLGCLLTGIAIVLSVNIT